MDEDGPGLHRQLEPGAGFQDPGAHGPGGAVGVWTVKNKNLQKITKKTKASKEINHHRDTEDTEGRDVWAGLRPKR